MRIALCEEIAYDLIKCYGPIFRHFATKKFRSVELTFIFSALEKARKSQKYFVLSVFDKNMNQSDPYVLLGL